MAWTWAVAVSTSLTRSRTLFAASSTVRRDCAACSLAAWVKLAVSFALCATESAVELISVMAVTAWSVSLAWRARMALVWLDWRLS